MALNQRSPPAISTTNPRHTDLKKLENVGVAGPVDHGRTHDDGFGDGAADGPFALRAWICRNG